MMTMILNILKLQCKCKKDRNAIAKRHIFFLKRGYARRKSIQQPKRKMQPQRKEIQENQSKTTASFLLKKSSCHQSSKRTKSQLKCYTIASASFSVNIKSFLLLNYLIKLGFMCR